MADHTPNPDLWMATAGTRWPLKGVFYTQTFLSPNLFFFGCTSRALTARQLYKWLSTKLLFNIAAHT